ncbi:hypothetical protein NESM_000080900 [Novymonas esmeraldas]|uniref:Uncharacterized protein n=1 Tax=Novymonas esmeraldas TaxID=1808958 RepID=A0AAW0F159_9TRYP
MLLLARGAAGHCAMLLRQQRSVGASTRRRLTGRSAAIAHPIRPMCTTTTERRDVVVPALPHTAGVDAARGARCDCCCVNKASSSPLKQMGGCYDSRPPQESCGVRLLSQPVGQLTAVQLEHFAQLRRVLQRLPCTREPVELARPRPVEQYVMCRVITSVDDGGGGGAEVPFTGVNHAFHKRVNPRGTTLRGILKGCAEQNALGAAAASGCAYADVTDVFLLSTRAPDADRGVSGTMFAEKHLGCATGGSAPPAAAPAAAAVPRDGATFPCPECWRHLCLVARARAERGRPPLRLFVYAASPAATVHLLAVAQQRMAVMAGSMEVCIVHG